MTRRTRASSRSSGDRALLAWLAARAVPGVEEVDGDVYRRTALVDGRPAAVEVHPSGDVRAPGAGALRDPSLRRRARLVLGLDADDARIEPVLRADPLLAPLVAARRGLRVAGAWDGFELAVRAVLGQQVSVAAGRGLAERIAVRHGVPLRRPAGSLTRLFPDAETLAAVELDGLPAARARAVRALAMSVVGGLAIDERQDRDSLRAALLELPGIGPWTVEYVAMRALRDPDAFPASDLALRSALGGISAAQAERRADAWRPWRAYAAMHLWTAAAAGADRDRAR
jgi:AraC family transcriptional regulator of adaptative response / DNA-3-methyladenine glycosylase II